MIKRLADRISLMLENIIQYQLLKLFPEDQSAISYSGLKTLTVDITTDDKVLKDALIFLTAQKLVKTSLKGFALTHEGRNAMNTYMPEMVDINDVESPEALIELSKNEEQEAAGEAAMAEHQEDLVGFEEVSPQPNHKRLKRHYTIPWIIAIILILLAIAFAFYFGVIRPREVNNRLNQQTISGLMVLGLRFRV